MTPEQLQAEFASFLKTKTKKELDVIVGFVPDEATLARESAFSKYQQLEGATRHCSMLGGYARADALKAWHRLMGEFNNEMSALDSHPVEEPKNPVDTKAPNT